MGGVPININVNNTGSGLDHHVLHNFVQFESKIKDKAYNLNMGAVNDNDAFDSDPKNGLLAYTIPSLIDILKKDTDFNNLVYSDFDGVTQPAVT